MGNQTYGYARVSTEQQNLDRQIDALTGYGVDRLYNEKMTGTRKDRPELKKLLENLTEGDTVVVESLSRLGRSTRDLLELTELFEKKGVHLISLTGQYSIKEIEQLTGVKKSTLYRYLEGEKGESVLQN